MKVIGKKINKMVKEKNEWRIDDFIREDFSVKNEMIEFLKEE